MTIFDIGKFHIGFFAVDHGFDGIDPVQVFKNSGKLSPSIVGLSRDDDDEFQIFAPIPIKSELQAELQDLLILQAQHNGSDMHLKVGSAPMIRIEGELVPVGEEPLTSTDLRRRN